MEKVIRVRLKLLVIAVTTLLLHAGCNDSGVSRALPSSRQAPGQSACQFVEQGWGPTGTVPLQVDVVATGLEVPWSLAFLPGGDWLVTERAGAIRLIRGGVPVPKAVAEVSTAEGGEGGLLGLALHPQFAANRLFFVYYTTDKNGETVNRLERFKLSEDHLSAVSDRVLIDGIPAGSFHDGGRIKFGPDGMLYVGTGDGRESERAQDPASLNGKLLRVDPESGTPSVFALGVRNLEAFDWINPDLIIAADHGPTGEFGLQGLDEVSFVTNGANLGWPKITGCQTGEGLVTPAISWKEAFPPGGGAIYTGDAIPDFKGNFMVGALGMEDGSARQLHRFVLDPVNRTITLHEAYLAGEYGRLRDVVQGPDGALYVTTSNCDTRGECPERKDVILRISKR